MSEEKTNTETQVTEESSAAEETENKEETGVTETEESSDTETQQEETKEDYSNVTTEEEASTILKDKGIDYDELTKEFQANGELLPETLERLEKQGIPPEIVNGYIEGQKVLAQKTLEDIASTVGGMENMTAIVKWAEVNLSQQEKDFYNSIHDPVGIKILLKSLEKDMRESEGYLPQQLQGGSGETKGDYFESMAEVEEAIQDPRYSKDPVYRAKVAQKITASREAGVIEIK